MTWLTWFTWPWRMAYFLLWFSTRVAASTWSDIRDNLSPGQHSTPGVATFVTRCHSDIELTTLGILITLTPGTLTLGTHSRETDQEERVLYVHGMYHDSPSSLRAEVGAIETRMLRAMRRRGSPGGVQ